MIHGRAHSYSGDGQRRLWEIGTHHEYHPDASSIERFGKWLDQGVIESEKHYAAPSSLLYLFGDFLICPTEPYKKGHVQEAAIKSVQHRHYVHTQE